MSYQSLGQMKSAEALFHETFSSLRIRIFWTTTASAGRSFLLSRERFQEALLAARELAKSEWPLPRLAGHTLAGQALLGMGSPAEAREEMTLAERETERLPQERSPRFPTRRYFGPTFFCERRTRQRASPRNECG